MSSTGIDRVVKKTLRLSLSLGAVVAQRASTRCRELPLGSASEYCNRGVQATGCLGFGRVASGWMARSVHLGCYAPAAHCRTSSPSIHHTNRRPFLFLGSCQ